MLKLLNIVKTYGKNKNLTKALDSVSIKIKGGELLAIVGASGSGKSTLLNILGLLDIPNCGDYFLNGENTKNLKDKELSYFRNKYFGFVIQNYALINDYTVFENVEIPINYSKNTKNKKERVEKVLENVKLLEKIEQKGSDLSGGEKQRVCIARAIVNDPSIILADEPTGSLDKKTGKNIIDILKKINKNLKTVIIVTHNESVANQCDRIITLEDGKIIKDKSRESEETSFGNIDASSFC
ncbi:MAG: ABC transporter ATP-binding protein [Oscillospiraceae bacterium]|jgi:putative ABC transport system ATP-binding protein|nr:ABC transporter ATP-binding protein [Oscillospiraceae bacterium]